MEGEAAAGRIGIWRGRCGERWGGGSRSRGARDGFLDEHGRAGGGPARPSFAARTGRRHPHPGDLPVSATRDRRCVSKVRWGELRRARLQQRGEGCPGGGGRRSRLSCASSKQASMQVGGMGGIGGMGEGEAARRDRRES
ncbi:hypothetical protein EJ04DRAFT_59707 [Polyplosphaeria fusca]|uniref:Uncharacterized protein n=1 Tax=Polyplosphaeria fusca TaxID=682080 RepID=A0A9P4R837_9PLEO|nr:hypothetical protein EJ04DRAFT_59707 [Polyplosphaeria fusca]